VEGLEPDPLARVLAALHEEHDACHCVVGLLVAAGALLPVEVEVVVLRPVVLLVLVDAVPADHRGPHLEAEVLVLGRRVVVEALEEVVGAPGLRAAVLAQAVGAAALQEQVVVAVAVLEGLPVVRDAVRPRCSSQVVGVGAVPVGEPVLVAAVALVPGEQVLPVPGAGEVVVAAAAGGEVAGGAGHHVLAAPVLGDATAALDAAADTVLGCYTVVVRAYALGQAAAELVGPVAEGLGHLHTGRMIVTEQLRQVADQNRSARQALLAASAHDYRHSAWLHHPGGQE